MVDGEGLAYMLKDSWDKWALQGMIYLSLGIQIFLILMGNCRKYSRCPLLTAFTWIAYLLADSVAIYAVGIITSKLKQSTITKTTEHDVHLMVFWAPFLLLHLGGPDTITAYSLEDNELWLRHLLYLFTQTVVTFYIFLMVWNGSNLSIMTIVMIIAGLCKYGERVWVLRASSAKQFRDSIPDPVLSYSKVVEEQKLREAEGFNVVSYQVSEVAEAAFECNLEGPDYSSDDKNLSKEKKYKRCQGELLAARAIINVFQRLFADLLLGFQDRDMSIAILKGKNFQVAFRIIEIELGFMFDMFYTKAKAIHTRRGVIRRLLVILSSAVILVMFSSREAHRGSSSRSDNAVTFVLLGAAIFFEVYSLIFLVFSDKAACWLIKNKKFKTLAVINWLQPLGRRRRWSCKVGQFNVLSFSLREKHLFFDPLLKFLRMDENLEKLLYKSYKEVTDEVKQLIIESFEVRKSRWNTRGRDVLDKFKQTERLGWSIEMEFDQSILIWHIATELSLAPAPLEKNDGEGLISRERISSLLSRYMVYLLVFHPSMLPMEIGRLKFKDTYIEAMKFFDDRKPSDQRISQIIFRYAIALFRMGNGMRGIDGESVSIINGCEQLRKGVNTKLNLTILKEDKSKFVLFHGCKLASQLEEIKDKGLRWEMVSEVWVAMLAYGASQCKGRSHCQQLRKGGELLTHVWLLMAHFGLTDHFQIPYSSPTVELRVT